MTETRTLNDAADRLISAINALDFDAALALFTPEAVIDDPSVGEIFEGHSGILDYFERFFRGYHTTTRFLSLTEYRSGRARLRVDFTGDFGHEIGLLDITTNDDGKILHIKANLE